MKFRYIQTLSFTIIALVLTLSSCKTQQMRKANEYYVNYQYNDAIKSYEKVLKKSTDTCAMKNLAHSYFKIHQFNQSEAWYGKIFAVSDAISHEYMMDYIQVLIAGQKHDEAIEWLNKYEQRNPGDPLVNVLKDELEHYGEYYMDSVKYTVQPININSKESSFGPVIYNNGIVFTSQRTTTTKTETDPWTGELCFNMYYAEKEDGEMNFASPKLLQGVVKSPFHDGPATFNPSGKQMIFTRNNSKKGKDLIAGESGMNNLEMYTAEVHSDKWMALKPFPFNNDNYSLGHPSMSTDGEMLFFVSDQPGGKGKTDIYVSKRSGSGSGWLSPVNIGNTINTAGSEMFPHYVEMEGKNPRLYFASTGHPGMGGLDLYYSEWTNGSWAPPIHLSYPVNSPADDFGISMYPHGKSGYFSTNRDNEQGYDKIMYFTVDESLTPVETEPEITEPVVVEKTDTIIKRDTVVKVEEVVIEQPAPKNEYFLSVRVIERNSLEIIPEATLKIENVSNGKIDESITDENGQLTVSLGFNRSADFIVTGSKKDFFNDRKLVTLRELVDSDTLQVSLVLDKLEVNKAIRLENIYYDFNKWDIREDAAIELDRLVATMKENPGMTIELGSHTDAQGSDEYNMDLSEKRALSAVDYLISKGIAQSRMVAKGYGESMLLNGCKNGVKCDDKEHELNRRTEFKVLSK